MCVCLCMCLCVCVCMYVCVCVLISEEAAIFFPVTCQLLQSRQRGACAVGT